MSSLFRNKYRIKSARLPGYDYSASGKYFITICTRNKIEYFGKISNRKMILSETGILARKCWLAIPSHFSDTCLDEFIIMPDHIHGIIIINPKSKSESKFKSKSESIVETPNLGVSTDPKKMGKSENQNWKSNSIGSIINQFKRICTIITKNNGLELVWQPRFHDHIIRTNLELNCIRKYIRDNPLKWDDQKPNKNRDYNV